MADYAKPMGDKHMTIIELTDVETDHLTTGLEVIRKVLLSEQVRWLIGSGDWNLTEAEELLLLSIIEDWSKE
jgi:hypothetical protein